LIAAAWLVAGANGFAQSALKTEIQHWPDGKVAAVALTFDDCVRSQLDFAVPELEKHGYRGTFFVLAQWLDLPATAEGSAERWRAAFQRGHEIGCHSYSHAHMMLQDEAGLRRQLADAKRVIEHWIGAGRCELFRMPWGESNGQVERQVRELFPLNRVDLKQGDKLICTVPRNAEQVIREIDRTVADRGVYLPIWHGIGADFMKMTLPDFQRVLDYLDQHTNVWVATQGEITKYAAIHQRGVLTVTNGISLQLPADMDQQLFSLPVSVRTTVPADWSHVGLRRGFASVVLPVTQSGDDRFVDYRLAPGETVQIERFVPVDPAALRLNEVANLKFSSTNGLAGWTLLAGKPSIANGALQLPANSRLLLDTAIADGQVRGRFRVLGDATNRVSLCSSRLFFRVHEFLPVGDHNGIYYEIANNPDQSEFRANRVLLWRQLATRDGDKYRMHWPDQICGSAAAPLKSGDWHEFTLTFSGDRLRYAVDGADVLHAAGLDPNSGRIGLGSANVAVEFGDVIVSRSEPR